MSEFRIYHRRGFIEARPYKPGEDLSALSISVEDQVGPDLKGGMIARNPDNPKDQWYISAEYFAKHYELSL